MRKIMPLLLVMMTLALLLTGCAALGPAKQQTADKKIDLTGYKHSDIFITPQELKNKLNSKDVVIIDADQPNVYANGHIPGAINVTWTDLSYVKGKPGDKNWGVAFNKQDLTKALEARGIDNKKTVVVYSDVLKGPGPDGRLVWQMRMAGLNNAKLLYGGKALWKEMGYELTSEPGKVAATTGLVLKDFNESYNATTDYVAKNLGKVKIIDVRTKKEFDGDTSHGEARGGHIPGAIHLEWKELLNQNGTPKPAQEIIALMKEKAGVTPEDDFVLY
ncbi:sulfurtransferase [Desulfotomaculum nigrificans]|uniref:sulfurtransferase n=1 Tax=Desulfotomaculum nigrificans TaxID=1565 RepID=UPI0001FADF17|nr:rhodanese-like domain-containing protein [Desulfotomaculum nigrificans]